MDSDAKQLSIDGRETPWDQTAIPHVATRREEFLAGLFGTWLAPDGNPTKAQRERAKRVARTAVEALDA